MDEVLMSTDIKPIFVFFTEIQPKIKQFLALIESIIPFFTDKMLHTLGLLFNECKKLIPKQYLPLPNMHLV